MNNSEFDINIVLPDHLALLQEVANGNHEWRKGIAHLLRRDLVMPRDLHTVEVSPRGRFALAGVVAGAVVVVTPQHKLPLIWGASGRVESVDVRVEDSDTVDAYGYDVKRSRLIASATVRLDDWPGQQWVFYNPVSLVGLPDLSHNYRK